MVEKLNILWCLCVFLSLQIWKIYCGWELKDELILNYGSLHVLVCQWEKSRSCMIMCTGLLEVMHVHRQYFLHCYMVKLVNELCASPGAVFSISPTGQGQGLVKWVRYEGLLAVKSG